jgi:hypothetical protein
MRGVAPRLGGRRIVAGPSRLFEGKDDKSSEHRALLHGVYAVHYSLEGSMSIVLIIVGFMIAVFGAKLFTMPSAGKSDALKSPGGGIVILVIQLTGWALVVAGVVKLVF